MIEYEYTDLMIQVVNPESFDSTILFSPEIKEKMIENIKQLEEENGYSEDDHIGRNSYEDDEYLFSVQLLFDAYDVYERMNENPYTGEYREGYRPVPYIHVIMRPEQSFERDKNGKMIFKDKSLNMGVSKKNDNRYVLKINNYIFQRFLLFLQTIFDGNWEMYSDFSTMEVTYEDGHKGMASDSMREENLFSQNDVLLHSLKLQNMGLKGQGKEMEQYALSLPEDARVPMPAVSFIRERETGKQVVTIAYYDMETNKMSSPLKRKIYNTSGFYGWFYRRKELISRIFTEALAMIFSHEFAHVANGHCDLAKADKTYCEQKRIAMCVEQNADDTAIRWRVLDLLFEGIDGNPQNPQLKYTREELKEEWAIRVFSAYLAMSWIYRDEERGWSAEVLDAFIKKQDLQHPIYQFRTFNIVNRALNSLENIILTEGTESLVTKDRYPIDRTLIDETETVIMDMLNSFEKYFAETYDDVRSTEEKLRESLKIESDSIPDEANKIPFLMPLCSERAGKEAEQISKTWPELKSRLEEVGTYCKLY